MSHTTQHTYRALRTASTTVLLAALATMGCDVTRHFSPTAPVYSGFVGSGNVVQEVRPIGGSIRGVVLSSEGTVRIEPGQGESLLVWAEDNLLPHIVTEVQAGILVISSDQPFHATRPIEFRLTVRSLELAELTGSGRILADTGVPTDRLDLRLTGSGELQFFGLDLRELDALLSGSGTIQVSGFANEQRVTHSGSGNFDGAELDSNAADVTLAGSGTITVRVRHRLFVLLSGSGTVRYYGNPVVDGTVTGSGAIRPMGG